MSMLGSAVDSPAIAALSRALYEEWREHFDLAATWQGLSHDRRDGWRAVALRATDIVLRATDIVLTRRLEESSDA